MKKHTNRISRFDQRATMPMHLSNAKGLPLLHNGDRFGADVIEFPPHGKVPMHTHPGDHVLFCLGGSGYVTIDRDAPDAITVGDCYLIHSMEPHAVEAGEYGLRLIVVGNDHRPVNSQERLNVNDL